MFWFDFRSPLEAVLWRARGGVLHDGASGTGLAGLLICINEAERQVLYTGLKDWTKGPPEAGRR